tara:strand:- start:5724 stop:6662 length:939 start_codon:yes stop_codon:yes gene_type:complete
MRRKIIKQGNNSYTFTLPIQWIREEKLENGGEVEINQEDNRLIIGIPKDLRRPDSSITLNLDDYNERTIRNILNQTYRKGYDQIILNFKDKKQVEDIKDITRNTLLGFEVVGEKDKKCIVQNIAEPSGERFNVILRKIFFLIKTEGEDILQDFKNKKINNLKERNNIKNSIDNYTNFCRRMIIKDRIGGTKNSYLMMIIVSRLSLIHHGYYYMYKFASSNKKLNLSKESLEILEKVNYAFNLLEDSFYEKDLNKSHKIGLLKNEIIFDKIYKLLQKTRGVENIILYHLGEIMRLIHMESTNIFGLTDMKKLE